MFNFFGLFGRKKKKKVESSGYVRCVSCGAECDSWAWVRTEGKCPICGYKRHVVGLGKYT